MKKKYHLLLVVVAIAALAAPGIALAQEIRPEKEAVKPPKPEKTLRGGVG